MPIFSSPFDASGPTGIGGSRRLRLLVVDETPTALAVIGRRLSHLGHEVVLADSGFAAVSILTAQRFDLILIDRDMQALCGVSTLRKMQASGLLGDASVLMITGRSDPAAIVEALEAGADDQIAKPFDFAVLDARIRHIVARARCIAELRHHNAALDARIARRAVELGEARSELEQLAADRAHIAASMAALNAQLEVFNAGRGS